MKGVSCADVSSGGRWLGSLPYHFVPANVNKPGGVKECGFGFYPHPRETAEVLTVAGVSLQPPSMSGQL